MQKRSDNDSTAPNAQQEPQWPWIVTSAQGSVKNSLNLECITSC